MPILPLPYLSICLCVYMSIYKSNPCYIFTYIHVYPMFLYVHISILSNSFYPSLNLSLPFQTNLWSMFLFRVHKMLRSILLGALFAIAFGNYKLTFIYINQNIRGGVKKSGSFGWCPPQSAPLPSCGQTFLWEFFLLNPLVWKNNWTDFKVKILPPTPPPPQHPVFFTGSGF